MADRNRILLAGVGQIGSRHLQSLKASRTPLEILLLEPSTDSIETALERYHHAPGENVHDVKVVVEESMLRRPIDFAIIATCSEPRRRIVQRLLETTDVYGFLLEKTLYARREDARFFELMAESGAKAWVNCSMRMMPLYRNWHRMAAGGKFTFQATGGDFGLITSAIHYADFFAWASDDADFTTDVKDLDAKPILSKRRGYAELTGTIRLRARNGSTATITRFPWGNLPLSLEIHCAAGRAHLRNRENRLQSQYAADEFAWNDTEAILPLQSAMTHRVVETWLEHRTCDLTPLPESVKIHAALLGPIEGWLRERPEMKLGEHPLPIPFT